MPNKPKLPPLTQAKPKEPAAESKSEQPMMEAVGEQLKAWMPDGKSLSKLGDKLSHLWSGPMTHPTEHLPRFSVKKFWDADSTPPALAALSRKVGEVLGKHSGARTPEIEAGIVMASLMHDVSYYYGGGIPEKTAADALFGAQIPAFVARLNPDAVDGAKKAALVDVVAVAAGGGFPFQESYSWSYGFDKSERGFASLKDGEKPKIQMIARETFKEVVGQIASGQFELSDVLKAKLAQTPPQYREQIKANLVKLAKSLQADFKAGREQDIPGFGAK